MNEIPFLHIRKITLQVSINVYHWWWQFLVYLPIKSNALNSGKHLSLAISFMSVTLLPLMKRKTSYFVWSFHILSTVKFRTVCVLSLKRIQLKQLMLTCRTKTSPCISANAVYELENSPIYLTSFSVMFYIKNPKLYLHLLVTSTRIYTVVLCILP